MDATKEDIGFLDKIRPPRPEDAGLEDCALPPDSIKEAFRKAATAVSSRVASVLSSGVADECEGGCVNDPLPGERSPPPPPPPSDALVGIEPVVDASGPCVAEKGGALVGDGYRGADLVGSGIPEGKEGVIVAPPAEGGDGRPCVDGVRGLKVGKKKEIGGGGEEGEGPTLVEGYLV